MQIYTKIKNSWKFCHLLITVISILIYYSWPFFLNICVYEICIYQIRNTSHLGIYVYITLSWEDPYLDGVGNDNPLQYSCLENSMDRGTWQATVHGDHRVGHDWATEHVCAHARTCTHTHTHTHTHSMHPTVLIYCWCIIVLMQTVCIILF